MKTKGWILMIAVLVTLAACKGSQEVKNNQSSTSVTVTPKTEKKERDEQGRKLVKVRTAEELLKAIGDSVSIELVADTYNLSDLNDNHSGKYFRWSEYVQQYEQKEGTDKSLIIRNVNNLRIFSAGEKPAHILTNNDKVTVLIFENALNIQLENLKMGHEAFVKNCMGGVLSFMSCNNVIMQKLELYGSGAWGFFALKSQNIILQSSSIYECTHKIFDLEKCTNVVVQSCEMRDNTPDVRGFVSSENSQNVVIQKCHFLNNKVNRPINDPKVAFFDLENTSKFQVADCKFEGNKCYHIQRYKGEPVVFQEVTIDDSKNEFLSKETQKAYWEDK